VKSASSDALEKLNSHSTLSPHRAIDTCFTIINPSDPQPRQPCPQQRSPSSTDVTDGHAAGIVKDTFDTLRTIDGMQQINFGTQIENPTMFQLMVSK
jgi:hypothetical protein